jgi:CheY-like chemotaxis protein
MNGRKKLGEILVEQNILSTKTVERMVSLSQRANKRLGTILEEIGLVTSQELAMALAIQHKLKTAFNFSKAYFAPELLSLVTPDTARQNLIFPLKIEGSKLCMAVFDPDNKKVINNIESNYSLTITPFVSTRTDINSAIYKHYFGLDTIEPKRNSVLIVDDDHLILERLSTILSRYYKVYTAPNGMDAYKEVVTKKPHVIVTDKEMPKLDGFGLLTAVHNTIDAEHTPIILISGATSTELESKAFKSGFFDFIQKPIKENTILTRVRRAFDYYEQSKYTIVRPQKY